MDRTLRLGVLLALVLALVPAPAGAAGLDVQFAVVEETPVSVTIRATITGATGPIQATARVEPLRDGESVPPVRGVKVDAVEKVAVYAHTPQTETQRIPIAEAIAALDTEILALKNTKGLKSEEIDARREEWHGKEAELEALRSEADKGATLTEVEEVVAHRYTLETRERLALVAHCNVGDAILLPAQSWAEPPPSLLLSDTELSLDDTLTNWGESTAVYEWTIDTGECRTPTGGWGSSGVLVVNINGQDYYDTENSSWWATNWPYRMQLTIDNSASTENLVDFPLMVKLTPARFDYSHSQPDGDDIRFVDADDSKALNFEVDTWDSGGDSWFWVQVPQIDAASNTDYIWMYYGSPTVGNGENAEVVWENGYVAVYHMNNKPGDATKILDSTANHNHGTKGAGAAAPTEVAGSVGMAQSFDGGDAIAVASNASLKPAQLSIVALVSITNWTAESLETIVSKGAVATTGTGYDLISPNNLAEMSASVYQSDGARKRATGDWIPRDANPSCYGMTADGVNVQCYRNGTAAGAAVAYDGTILHNNNALYIGKYYLGASYYLRGPICELRLSSVARTAEWIEAENLALTDALLTYGVEDLPDAAAPVVPVPVIETAEALLCVAVAWAAVKQRHIILYVAAFVLLLFTGFAIAETTGMLAVMPFCFAVYMLYMAALSVGRR